MNVIIDYGVGNLFSLKSSFAFLGEPVRVSSDPDEIYKADRVILPGVGAFADAAARLRAGGLDEAVKSVAKKGTPLLGICLGMQLLFDASEEYGYHAGLGLLPGCVRRIPVPDESYKIPQIGWNSLHIVREHPLFANTNEGDFVYFVHSFHAEDCGEALLATTDYGTTVTAAAARGNVCGTQFHPEKSGEVGLSILRAFCAI